MPIVTAVLIGVNFIMKLGKAHVILWRVYNGGLRTAGFRGRAVAHLGVRSSAPNAKTGTWVLDDGSGSGLCPSPENFLTSEWKMARFSAFWVLFLQTAVI